jgi:NAD(P)-dependent dehydrogenase (short-subunit alcohol dehydrogenase family)
VPELSGRIAVVTGAARGQGRSHAQALAEAGADVVLTDICRDIDSVPYGLAGEDDLAETAQLVEKTGRRAVVVTADVRQRAAMERVVATAIDELGGLDIVVANAGICGFGEMPTLTEAQWDDMVAVNLTGVFNTFRAAVPHLVAQGRGRLIATSSGAGRTGTPNLSHYAATKWGVIGFVKSVALEVAAHGVTANVVPGDRRHPDGPQRGPLRPVRPRHRGAHQGCRPPAVRGDEPDARAMARPDRDLACRAVPGLRQGQLHLR